MIAVATHRGAWMALLGLDIGRGRGDVTALTCGAAARSRVGAAGIADITRALDA